MASRPTDQPTLSAADVEKLSPDERAQLVSDRSLDGLSELDPEFRARVEAKARRLLAERGLLETELG